MKYRYVSSRSSYSWSGESLILMILMLLTYLWSLYTCCNLNANSLLNEFVTKMFFSLYQIPEHIMLTFNSSFCLQPLYSSQTDDTVVQQHLTFKKQPSFKHLTNHLARVTRGGFITPSHLNGGPLGSAYEWRDRSGGSISICYRDWLWITRWIHYN